MTEPAAAAAAEVPGKIAGLVITVIVLVILIGWIAVWQGALHRSDTTLVGAFMLLWYWANNEALDIKRLPTAIAGALVGVGIAWVLAQGVSGPNSTMLLAGLGLLILALYLDVIKAFPFAINASTMLFVTLAAAPLVQLHVNWTELVLSIAIGGLFFGGVIEGLKRLTAKSAGAPQ
ncbi:MAG: hypothetical protein WBL74_09060 [Novosphingobium sp.]|uniref:hypothetical protein n=1 Tax=Novosphingobium sp. TaxID=1874826 RepID=UPI003C7A2277